MKAILFALFVGLLMVGCGESYDAIDLDDPEIRKGIIAKEMTPDQIAGAERLAATPACETQGFARGRNILGLQFHPEAEMLPDFERWLIGHSAELAQAGIAPEALRQDAKVHGPALRAAGQAMFRHWLRELEP